MSRGQMDVGFWVRLFNILVDVVRGNLVLALALTLALYSPSFAETN